jgi:hypothetical protein
MKKRCRKKSCGRKYTEADAASNKRHVAYRVKLNQENRKRGTYGNGDGKDLSHTTSGKLVQEDQSTNRARNGKDGKSTKKRIRLR